MMHASVAFQHRPAGNDQTKQKQRSYFFIGKDRHPMPFHGTHMSIAILYNCCARLSLV